MTRAGDGTIAARAIGSGGTLASPCTLAGGADEWTGLAVVGPDGGLHLAFITGSQNRYAKSCP